MQRIIVHWTAGAYRASSYDKRAYHFLIEGDGTIVRGDSSIAANYPPLSDGYAAHTRALNSGSIGVAVCGMAGARERPFDAGRYPIVQEQWDKMIEVISQLCDFYRIPLLPETVLTHAEVQFTLGVRQNSKWDFTRLPFKPQLHGAKAVGDDLRSKIKERMSVYGTTSSIPYGRGVVTATRLNLRERPSGSAHVIGLLEQDAQVEVVKIQGYWLNVETELGEGWVHRDYIEMIDGPKVSEPTTSDPLRCYITAFQHKLDVLEIPIDDAKYEELEEVFQTLLEKLSW